MTARILMASLLHETNSFNLIPTDEAAFAARYLHWEDAKAREALAGSATEMAGFIAGSDAQGWKTQIAFAAAASPSGPMEATLFARLKARLLANARDFAPEGVLLALHGAMTTACSGDPEGDLVSELREMVGPLVPIVVTLDMHANLSPRLVEAADGICIYETYPHIDHVETATRAVAALAGLLDGQRRRGKAGRASRAALVRLPMLDAADHGRTAPSGPMNAILTQLEGLRQDADLVTAAIAIGFTWADTPNAGPAVVLHAAPESTTDLRALGSEIADQLWHSRHETRLTEPSPAEALAARHGAGSGPLVIADFADNPAGGAYGDSVNLLRAMIDADLQGAVFATVFDPEAARLSHEAGLGARLTLALGGKSAPQICPPLTLEVEVCALHAGRITLEGPYLRGVTVDQGPMARLRHRGIDILIASRPMAVTDLQQLRVLGVDPLACDVIALKSRNHHRAAFGPIARQVILTDAGGIASTNFQSIPYHRLPRPIWPLDSAAGPDAIRIQEFRHHD